MTMLNWKSTFSLLLVIFICDFKSTKSDLINFKSVPSLPNICKNLPSILNKPGNYSLHIRLLSTQIDKLTKEAKNLLQTALQKLPDYLDEQQYRRWEMARQDERENRSKKFCEYGFVGKELLNDNEALKRLKVNLIKLGCERRRAQLMNLETKLVLGKKS